MAAESETSWFDRDEFWEANAPYLFGEQRWDQTPEQVDAMLDLLGVQPGRSICDWCCGPGRHTLELARRGYHVTGIDRTESYLDQACDTVVAEKLGDLVEFVQSDMRRFERRDAFDAVINMFTSFGYFADPADDELVARHMFESLRQDGTLLMELIGKEILAAQFRERDWSREADGTIMLEERRISANWSWLDCTWTLLRGGEERAFELSHRIYSAAELVQLLERVGFASVDVFGSLQQTPYDHTARRLVIRARK